MAVRQMKKFREKLRNMSPEELAREAADLRQKVWAQQIQRVTGQLQDAHQVKEAKRNLARVLTAKRERERASAGQAARTRSGR